MTPLVFSPKQRRVLTWWRPGSTDCGHQALICDGAVRSGKTLCAGLSFLCWATLTFQGRRFALCGKTIQSVRRNLWSEAQPVLRALGFSWTERISRGQITLRLGERENTFLLFGGADERAAGLIQGVTLAGALLDEAVLMPRSFVEKGALHLTFTMADNPGLSPKVLARYESMFRGTFYRRFVLGEWAAAEGLVYDFFSPELVQAVPEQMDGPWYISCDYGTVNPTSMGLWGQKGGVWYRTAEFYYDSRKTGRQQTDGEYADDLARLAGGQDIRGVVLDPSAASFREELLRRGWTVYRAENEVLSGIRRTAELLRAGQLVICTPCEDAIREFGLYRWDTAASGDRVVKEHDHAMDDIRYFAVTVAGRRREGFFAGTVERSG